MTVSLRNALHGCFLPRTQDKADLCSQISITIWGGGIFPYDILTRLHEQEEFPVRGLAALLESVSPDRVRNRHLAPASHQAPAANHSGGWREGVEECGSSRSYRWVLLVVTADPVAPVAEADNADSNLSGLLARVRLCVLPLAGLAEEGQRPAASVRSL